MYVNRRSCVAIVSCRHSSRKKGGLSYSAVYTGTVGRDGRSTSTCSTQLITQKTNTHNNKK